MKAAHAIAFILVVIGGINWGLIGVNPAWNVVGKIFGSVSWLERTVYILVGLSAIYLVITHKKTCSCCDKKGAAAPMM